MAWPDTLTAHMLYHFDQAFDGTGWVLLLGNDGARDVAVIRDPSGEHSVSLSLTTREQQAPGDIAASMVQELRAMAVSRGWLAPPLGH